MQVKLWNVPIFTLPQDFIVKRSSLYCWEGKIKSKFLEFQNLQWGYRSISAIVGLTLQTSY
jgi:hypothetical protein